MATLYELTSEYASLLDMIESGEIPEEAINDTLESVNAEFEQKCDNVACAIKNLLAEAKMIRDEEKRLAERRQAKERSAEGLKRYLSQSLIAVGKNKLETTRAVLSFRRSTAVEIDGDAFMKWAKRHKEFLTVKDPEPNKTAIKDALKNGVAVKGATMVENYNIQIG